MTNKDPFLFRLYWFIRSRPILLRRAWRARLARSRSRRGADIVSARWTPAESHSLDRVVWTNSAVVADYLHHRISDSGADWVHWMLYRYAVGKNLNALVIGCGSGWLDRVLAGDARIAHVTAFDISAGAVEAARERAKNDGIDSRITYDVADLNADRPLGGPYDLVLAHDSIHHITNLENFFERVNASLTPTGVLLCCEYVGPDRFQYSDEQMRIINDFFRVLPERLRWLPLTNATAAERYRADPVRVAEIDPSEAARSGSIMPIVRAKLKVLEEIPYGGGLLAPLLYEAIANFREDDEGDATILRLLCAAEDVLTRHEVVPSDYFVVAAGRR